MYSVLGALREYEAFEPYAHKDIKRFQAQNSLSLLLASETCPIRLHKLKPGGSEA